MLLKWFLKFSLFLFFTTTVLTDSSPTRFKNYKPTPIEKLKLEDRNYWYRISEETLKLNSKIFKQPEIPIAKNVIFFIGDGMGISTITATRIYKGQRKFDKSGEDYRLIYEDFPHLALVKTYNVDMQVPDSAGSGTALFTGVKTNYGVIGLDSQSNKTNFDKTTYEKSKLETIITWAQKAKKATGIITTTRITHATPAATYAHVNSRKWECDSAIPLEIRNDCKDIARQLIEDEPGRNFNVIMGGGYQQFGYNQANSPDSCIRDDRRNLTRLWLDKHRLNRAEFVINNRQLNGIGDDCEYLLGLFDRNNLPYELLRDQGPNGAPSLKQMLAKGLKVLKRNPQGFVLVVEGGLIDYAHHHNYARLALEESVQLEEAIELAINQTSSDTLIIVTADHSHSMSFNGYAHRGNDILGYGIDDPENYMKPALTLTYSSGPGFSYQYAKDEINPQRPLTDLRHDINRIDNPTYQHSVGYRNDYGAHSGEDVALFAKGPGSRLFHGIIEQNYIAHVISYSACIGPRANLNDFCKFSKSTAANSRVSRLDFTIFIILMTITQFL